MRFVSGRKQIALMADEKSPARISHRLLAINRSEMRINMTELYDLRVNSRKSTLGIDDEKIYFGWKYYAERDNMLQKTCRVRLYEADSGRLVWDSGVKSTCESAHFPYDGERLAASTRYMWRVDAVDNYCDEYSGEAYFETGLMGDGIDVWSGARFIGSPYDSVNTDGLTSYGISTYITLVDADRTCLAFNVRDKDNYMALELDFADERIFVRRYNDGAWTDAVPCVTTYGEQNGYGTYLLKGQKNSLDITVAGTCLSVTINGKKAIDAENILPQNEAFMPRVEGMGNLGIRQDGGKCILNDFAVCEVPEDGTGSQNNKNKLIKKYDELVAEDEFYVFNPAGAVYLRKLFDVKGSIKKARLYATAMGFYDVYINNNKINDSFYNPGFTDYRKRVMYQTYDVTEAVREGCNVIGAVVTRGYYTGYVGYTPMPMVYGKKNAFLAKLVLEYEDGSRTVLVTDESWEFTDEGPIISSDYQQGECYDARKEFNRLEAGSLFKSCGIIETPSKVVPTNGELPAGERFLITAQEGEEARVERIIEAKPEYVENPKGHFVYDFGQNMVGVVRLVINGEGRRGMSVKLRYGEMSYTDGRLYIANMRSAANTDCYTIKGEKREVFVPSGACHGFRYVEISGNGYGLSEHELKELVVEVEGLVITNTTDVTGNFRCSNDDVNKLQSNIMWGQRGNSLLVYTDCPQRNERMGWTGDAQVFVATAAYNMDIKTFMEKWLTDLRDAQLMYNRDGAVPDTAPLGGDNRRMGGCAGWGDAAVIVPWKLYLATGDIGILEKNYDMMRAWVEYQSRADRQFDGVRTVDGEQMPDCSDISSGNFIQIQQSRGDHLTFDASTPFILTATAYAAYVAGLLARTAELLGKTDDAKRYTERYENVKRAFNEAWVCEDGSLAYWGEMSKPEPDSFGNIINRTRYAEGEDKTKRPSQTAYALALDFDLIPEEKRDMTAKCLRRAVAGRDNRLSVGFLGIEHLVPALCKSGDYDMAFSLLEQTGFPGWLYSVRNGATTIWERWNSYIAETGTFGEVSMNSFNHYAYGAIGEWLYDTVAGISTSDERGCTGYKQIVLKPHIGGKLTYAEGWHETPYGRVSSSWRFENGRTVYNCEIPPNTTAKLYLPWHNLQEKNQTVINLGSGSYEFMEE